MEAPSVGSAPFIARRPFKAGGHDYEGADLFDEKKALNDGLTPYQIANLKRQAYLVPLSRSSYEASVGRRPPGSVGAGFDPKWLRDQGIIDEIPTVEVKTSKVVTPKVPAEAGESTQYRGCSIVPYKSGPFTTYDVLNAEGEAMRPKRFKKFDGATAFIDSTLGPVAAGSEEGDVPAGETKELAADGDDVQPGAD